jgi:hypothetical protein
MCLYLPYALERKHPNENRDFAWQWLCADDDDLYACHEQARHRCEESGGWIVAPRGGGCLVESQVLGAWLSRGCLVEVQVLGAWLRHRCLVLGWGRAGGI